ncbi:MAG: PepSY-associated TM helix domain-containing protein [Colwellia sp.]|nr:PepSY-associated TM helix domain-containing protein [Colwellia sp.]
MNKKTLSIARLLHVYVSMILFSLLIFFSVTGVTLNHPEWFKSITPSTNEMELTLPINHVSGESISQAEIDDITLQVEQALEINLKDAMFEVMTDELYFALKKAGISTTITVDLTSGEVFYEQINYGLWAIVNDLHKGRNTSVFWQWVIDITSVLFIVFAVTGFMLAMPQRRFSKTLASSLFFTTMMISATIMFS